MQTGTIRFHKGVDRYGAKPPEGYPFRWAVIACFKDEEGLIDPWPLLREAVPKVMAIVGANSAIAEFWRRKRKGILRRWSETKIGEVDLESLTKISDEVLLEEEFPSRIRFLMENSVVLWEESEMWSHIGGPSPYHDSVTLSFFTKRDLSLVFENIFTEVAYKIGVNIGPKVLKEEVL
ncbi:MAG: hypothetical protein ACFFDI_30335 [Promethearchaeota archaeon]